MTRSDFVVKLDEIMDRPVGTTQFGQRLDAHSGWDSIAMMAFIAMVDAEFELRVAGPMLAAARTVDDLAALVGDRVTT